jgi:chromosome partitioning protein
MQDMSRVIAVFNQSGGVGKSTLTMNLGYHLSQRKHRLLLVDMDPQASLTLFMGLEPSKLKESEIIYAALMKDSPLANLRRSVLGIDLIPSNILLSGAEVELVVADVRDYRLQQAIAPVLAEYDFILLDCPPSLGLLSYISLVASTHVLVPIQTEYKSFYGTELLFNTFARVKSRSNRNLQLAGFIPTMYDSRKKKQHVPVLAEIEAQMSKYATVFPPIPDAIDFANAVQNHLPLACYDAKHPATVVLEQIVKGLEEL